MKLRYIPLCLAAGTLLFASSAFADQMGRLPVIARGELRREIRATPILERPDRPGHFYGNTVRRLYYRGVTQSVSTPAAPTTTTQQ